MTTVEALFGPVVAAGAGVRVEEVRSAVPVPVDTAGEVDWLEAPLPAPVVELPKPKVVAGVEATGELAKALVEVPKPNAVAGVEATEELTKALVEVEATEELVKALEEVPKPYAVAGVEATEELVKTLEETIDAGLEAEELAILVCKAVLA
jgi:hypothetical protein